jgi:hypothetical protein
MLVKEQAQNSDKLIRKILSGNFLDVQLCSERYQLVHIRILNIVGLQKISVWEEVYKGGNQLTIDISSLARGLYKIIVNYPEENLREEIFKIY